MASGFFRIDRSTRSLSFLLFYVREHRECDAADGDGRRDDKTERTALLPWLAPGRSSFAAIRAVPRSVTVAAERVNDTTT